MAPKDEIQILRREDGNLYVKMIALLKKGGIDTDTFNRKSCKTLYELFEEILHRDVVLAYVPQTGRIVRCAITAAILIRVPSERLQLLEVGREFIRTQKRHDKIKEWSMSETKKSGEELNAAAVRGLREELGLEISPKQLEPLWLGGHEFPMYQSNTYAGLWSYTMIQRFLLELPKRPWPEMTRVVEDGKTKIYLKWFPY